jgi:predicted nucleic acid-binding protein
VGVVVFDSDVLIGFLNARDAHHAAAVERMRAALAPGMRLWISAVNHAEILIGPLRAGKQDVVDAMLARFSFETQPIDVALARRAAEVRARTGLKLPDAFALATAIDAERRGHHDVALATFDERVTKARAKLSRG